MATAARWSIKSGRGASPSPVQTVNDDGGMKMNRLRGVTERESTRRRETVDMPLPNHRYPPCDILESLNLDQAPFPDTLQRTQTITHCEVHCVSRRMMTAFLAPCSGISERSISWRLRDHVQACIQRLGLGGRAWMRMKEQYTQEKRRRCYGVDSVLLLRNILVT